MINKDIVLAIETSCDETSIAIIRNWGHVVAMETASSIDLHQETRWVIPEVAARAQDEYIIPVLNSVKQKSWLWIADIDAICVANWPWLIWSLLVWISTANTLSMVYKKPLFWINHIKWHIFANLLERRLTDIKFPAIVLTVSWWHNEIYIWKNLNDFELIWETLDDSAGEAFDKCWRLLGLPYPAWPLISDLADNWDKNFFKFPRAMKNSWDYDFSFSGLKTAFLYETRKYDDINEEQKNDFAAWLQEAICDILSEKLVNASRQFWAKQIHLSGWVSANKRLRELVSSRSDLEILYPKKLEYCTDNAAMIWAAGYYQDIKNANFVEAVLR